MTTNPLLRNDNVYLRKTEWMPRPDRRLSEWRYVAEEVLLRARDEWDRAEQHRLQVETNVKQLEVAAKQRTDAEEKVQQARADAVIDDELRRRYLSGGGSEHMFIAERQRLRHEFATKVALGEAEPITPSLERTKEELRRLRGHRLAMPDPR